MLIEQGIKGARYGDFVKIPKEDLTDETLERVKRLLTVQICELVSVLAEGNDNFYIVKDSLDGNSVTVGWNLFFPTLRERTEE